MNNLEYAAKVETFSLFAGLQLMPTGKLVVDEWWFGPVVGQHKSISVKFMTVIFHIFHTIRRTRF